MNSRLKRPLSLFLSFFLIVSLLPAFSLADEAEEAPPSSYSVQVSPTEHGSLSAAPQSASPGETVTLTAVPENGYEIAAVYVDDEPLSPVEGVYSFIMPEKDVTASAVFRQQAPLLASQEGNGEQEEETDTPAREESEAHIPEEGMLPVMTYAANAYTYTTITGYEKGSGIESIETTSTYPWATYQEPQILKSGNAKVSSSVSEIKITVCGAGTLSFQYRVYSATTESNPDSLLVSVEREITGSTANSSFGSNRFYGETGWQNMVLNIDAADDDVTTVYIAYKKNGSTDHEFDCALLKDIRFNSGKAIVTVESSNPSFGTVTGGGEFLAGDTATVTATPSEGGKFFGWVQDGVWLETENTTLNVVAAEDTTVTALFGSAADTVAQNRGTGAIYTDLATALEFAVSGNVLMLVNDCSLGENTIIPAGVTLYIPYNNTYDADGNADGIEDVHNECFANESDTFCRLTINSGVTMDVNGKLLIGGVISYPSQYYQGHTSGAHGRITNNGTITVSGGRIDCYGFIDGAGTVSAMTGYVYEPFVVYDFAGGSNTLALYEADQNPFTQYTMQNISCTLEIHDTAAYGVYCNLYASSEYNKTNTLLIGGGITAQTAMVKLSDGAYVRRTVDKSKFISGATCSEVGGYGADIYRTDYVITGGASLNNIQMEVYGVNVSVNRYPIPYCFSYTLTSGDYTMPKGWTILPGTELTVASGASLTVAGELFVLDGLVNTGMSGKFYPSSEQLKTAGFSSSGVLKVNGTLCLLDRSAFGGVVQSDGTGTVKVGYNVSVLNTSLQFGAVGSYDDNTCILNLPGRVQTDSGLENLIAGTVYTARGGTMWTLEGFTVTSYAKQTVQTEPTSGKYKKLSNGYYSIYGGPETFTTNQTMYGSFNNGEVLERFLTVNKTYYNANDATRTAISEPVVINGNATFTVSRTTAGSSYNFIVQYSKGGEPITLKPDTNGIYTIPNVSDTTTITVISVKKGDADVDGNLTVADVTAMRRTLAGSQSLVNAFASLAADCDADGNLTAADVTILRRHLAGYSTIL